MLNSHFLKSNEESQLRSVVGESLWEGMRSKGVVVSGVTTSPWELSEHKETQELKET